MEKGNIRNNIETAFQQCKERGWMNELTASTITEEDLAAFERKYQVKLPPFYKTFLTAYRLPGRTYEICGVACQFNEISPLWLILYGIFNMSELSEYVEIFREDACEFRQSTKEACKMLVPIGDWGAGWGPLCLDLTRDEALADEEDEATWSLVWFDHEEFNWGQDYASDDGLLHGTPAAPNLETLLDWYFRGSLEPEFEEENHVRVSYERLNNMDFCNSYWEDKWKD